MGDAYGTFDAGVGDCPWCFNEDDVAEDVIFVAVVGGEEYV